MSSTSFGEKSPISLLAPSDRFAISVLPWVRDHSMQWLLRICCELLGPLPHRGPEVKKDERPLYYTRNNLSGVIGRSRTRVPVA